MMAKQQDSYANDADSITVSTHHHHLPNQLNHILQAMPSGIIILDASGRVIEANPVAQQLLVVPLIHQLWRHIIGQAFAPRNDDGHEVSLSSGRRVHMAITPLTPDAGQLIVLTDLTETRQLQNNLAQLQRLSALGTMVANLAHQIRTPLSAAMLYAQNLAISDLPQQAQQRFQSKLMERLNELEYQVNNMLLMAQGRTNHDFNVVDVSYLFELVQHNCEPIAAKQAITIECQLTEELFIWGNQHQLVSAINNMLMNAVEADASQITLIASRINHEIVIEIKDNGRGFNPNLQRKLTEPFFTTKAQGTGLGLGVVQGVIQQHQGKLSFTSKPDNGSHFIIRLPVMDDHKVQANE